MNALFICSRNQWRSPTAERVFSKHMNTRSAGTSKQAKRVVSARDIVWADHIFVMEYHHKQRLVEQFNKNLRNKKITVLEIPDEYHFMHPDLVELLRQAMPPYL
ncbi:low molecular weight protein tyrosine phosphatase family protein [Acinetobacter ursingii]|uniref:low molecular weight protein tyrosine phosphatase family protein n=1 Tax=Acinetobacter ursingii TaxID=108980 RepID=UPI00124EEBD9|nr:protein tyrosine phosphatase [Acinetobacter ursingii]